MDIVVLNGFFRDFRAQNEPLKGPAEAVQSSLRLSSSLKVKEDLITDLDRHDRIADLSDRNDISLVAIRYHSEQQKCHCMIGKCVAQQKHPRIAAILGDQINDGFDEIRKRDPKRSP